VTREGLAEAAVVPLLRDAEVEAELERWYAERDLSMPGLVLRQADVPKGATVVPNPRGTAPGLRMDLATATVYVLPGVPAEMTAMAEQHVLPEIVSRAGQPAPSVQRVVRVALEGEPVVASRLVPLLEGRDDAEPATRSRSATEGLEGRDDAELATRSRSATGRLEEGIRIGYLPEPGEVRVRVTGRDAAAVTRVAKQVRVLLGPAAFTEDDDTLDAVVHRLLAERDATVAVAESLTGGLLAAALTAAPGASATFRGGLTAYATDVKGSDLGVDEALLAAEGPVDPDVALQMASGVRERFGATYGLATTGVAGPELVGERPVGTVFVAMAGPRGRALASRRLTGDRDRIRRLTVIHALDLLRRHLVGLPPYDPGDEIGQ